MLISTGPKVCRRPLFKALSKERSSMPPNPPGCGVLMWLKRFKSGSAIPSLAWVLEQNWILNNFGDVITCTVPMAPGLQVPNLSAVKTPCGRFQFRALPWRLHEPDSLPVDRRLARQPLRPSTCNT
jgi:hypothetical protein